VVILGYTLLFIGFLTALGGEFMLLAMAYKRSLLWFFGCLMFPVLWLFFIFFNPKITIKPFIALVLGALVAGLGCRLAGIKF
jgi:hypothetical protein